MANSILYNAGIFASNFDRAGKVYAKLDDKEKALRDKNEHHLESYHYIHKDSFIKKIRRENVKVFLDSGAFSAYSQGVKIDIGKYCDYCIRNQDIIRFPAVLDVIDFEDKEKAVKGTYWNQMEIERRFKAAGVCFEGTGYGPLPTAHYGEPDEVVKHYADNYEYMALGGLVPVSTPQMILWLDHLWERILCHPDGTPRVKVHGFGITSLPVMQRYPWYSVDSSTWVQWAANGMILLPNRGGQLNVSSRSSSRKVQGQHIDNLRESERVALESELLSYSIDTQRLRDYYYSRWAFNSYAFPAYLNTPGRGFAKRFIRDQPGLF